ncbi:bifunctional cytidylyltransferase/SDR family oxidoreductase [Bailinhaonella thermotolerans]|uniref:2-C-methyl-D-erythritol 4-phosphate cytidylyltransferase n=1 Tax=Bailinhaonella thermotolerans TaxID=1070861 RepID=A0A3A4ANG9_9ACTN|nr:bifunctional cytidylyltransferase/SDR family oxidoreductase [Bailinhaonella thermotolerans]RJL30511.1 SDR family NAD(P)-dependent oxidoreductase [Bailinhaonella thermotolerans]
MAETTQQRRTVGVVLAGGVGQRVGLEIPKQLLKIAGKPIIEHTLAVFDAAPEIDEILVLMTPGYTGEIEKIVAKGGYRKVTRVLEGGASRTETTWRAIQALSEAGDDCDVLLHDAVRPLLEPRIIADCVAALGRHRAVDVAIPSSDTIIVTARGRNGEFIRDIPERSRLRRGQTPQCFRLSTIREAYELALADPEFENSPPTDDCGVVLRYLPEVPIFVVDGSEHNMKVTHPVDVFIADKLFQLGSRAPVQPSAEAYTRALSGKTMVVFGGSYGIGGDIVELARGFGANVYSFSRSQNDVRVEDAAAVAAALEKAHSETGRVDYVVNTAGVLHTGKLGETSDETLNETVAVNYLGPVYVARAAIRYLRETGGHLLLYTSSSYTRGRADYSLYSSTKAAVVNLTQALADEWAEYGVRVNCINPERTQTPMRVRAFGEEPPDTLLSSKVVALTSVDVLVSDTTGQVFDVRRLDPEGLTPGDPDAIAGVLPTSENPPSSHQG